MGDPVVWATVIIVALFLAGDADDHCSNQCFFCDAVQFECEDDEDVQLEEE